MPDYAGTRHLPYRRVLGLIVFTIPVSRSDNFDECDQDAFPYSNGALVDLNSLLPANSGWQLYDATGINDADQIVGDGVLNGQLEGFLRDLNIATPEPASGILVAIGLLFVCALPVAARRLRM